MTKQQEYNALWDSYIGIKAELEKANASNRILQNQLGHKTEAYQILIDEHLLDAAELKQVKAELAHMKESEVLEGKILQTVSQHRGIKRETE